MWCRCLLLGLLTGLAAAILATASPVTAGALPTPTDVECHLCEEEIRLIREMETAAAARATSAATATPSPAPVAAGPTVTEVVSSSPEAQENAGTMAVTTGVPAEQAPVQPVAIYFFWGDGCPHCAAAKPFLADLAGRYPGVEVRPYEVWYVEDNRDLFYKMAAAHGFQPSAVPTIFIGNQYWVGFSDALAVEMEAAVGQCLQDGCPDAGQGIIPASEPAPPTATVTVPTVTTTPVAEKDAAVAAPTATTASVTPEQAASSGQEVGSSAQAGEPAASGRPSDMLNIPLIGQINLATQSLAVSTALIAFVDGFNPCSLWVLSILLALSLRTGSRKKVFLIGLIFIAITGLVYMLFIAGLFTVFSVISFLGWVQVLVALVAAFFALVNIKDYFWYKEGLSFTIDDAQKPGIYNRMRRVLQAGDSVGGMIAATAVLAAGVSIVEFSCTAGFPVLWTNLLVAQQATALTFVLLLALYMLIYQLDELGIFLAAVLTFKAGKLEEKHGRVLKLIGGMLMLTLAVVMLVNPALMNQVSSSLIIFGVAFAAALVVLFVHRLLLPRLGIRIGSEMPAARGRHSRPRTG